MLNENYKNLKVDPTFIDTLNSINEQYDMPLSADLIQRAEELKEEMSKPTYIGSVHKDILEAYRETAPPSEKYNQVLFKKFEKHILS